MSTLTRPTVTVHASARIVMCCTVAAVTSLVLTMRSAKRASVSSSVSTTRRGAMVPVSIRRAMSTTVARVELGARTTNFASTVRANCIAPIPTTSAKMSASTRACRPSTAAAVTTHASAIRPVWRGIASWRASLTKLHAAMSASTPSPTRCTVAAAINLVTRCVSRANAWSIAATRCWSAGNLASFLKPMNRTVAAAIKLARQTRSVTPGSASASTTCAARIASISRPTRPIVQMWQHLRRGSNLRSRHVWVQR